MARMTTRKWLQELRHSGLSEESCVNSSGLLGNPEKEGPLEKFVNTSVGKKVPCLASAYLLLAVYLEWR